MVPIDFIEKKKLGLEHSPDEMKEFIISYVKGDIPDYQMAAWLMAVNFQGMTDREIVALVDIMLHSGETIDLSDINKFKVDKHSTGGVGDKISLVLAPLAASVGCIVPMISGRSLGHTGGTLDKLESIPGFRINLSKEEFENHVKKYGFAIIGQTDEIVPADRKMYALRDVTATVKSTPLICGSILSKKIAEGVDGLVLDVKTGDGAFLQEYNQSQKLAKELKKIGEYFGLKVKSVITDMNQPLGGAVGNWLEVIEAVQVLKNEGPEDVKEISIYLGTWMVIMSGIEKDFDKAKKLLLDSVESGKAYDKFLELVKNQGGDVSVIEHPEKYKSANCIEPVVAGNSGYVRDIDTYMIGMASIILGAGRKTLNDSIKPETGIIVQKKIGDYIAKGEPLGIIYSDDDETLKEAKEAFIKAYEISELAASSPPLIYETF
jgi:pyrimidine-nucleoside phosphorylase